MTSAATGRMARILGAVFRVKAIAPAQRDEGGRYVSPHRLAVRAKCREQCAAMGKEVPEALR
ncbi:hypothetical protein [Sphingopyxis sp. FD7]|uniref:hypothetical protein n=1 Tax=Sphingopyxis sp. FD7 TaxID=1914525 RepID=UPI000DC62173|nr:hypothetical protein [Sphingopyxis sp. FD7]BBB13637.1 hypothetical protein SPYCA_2895 [Sphingopyxis sp. FD7]